jgi:hypothetical protein
MRRVFVALLLAGATALAVGLPAGADTVGDATPACADIDDNPGGAAGFSLPETGRATVTGSVTVAAASCATVDYTMWVSYQTAGGQTTTTHVKSDQISGDGSAFFEDGRDFVGTFSVTVPRNLASVCVGFTTSSGSTTVDTAPSTFSPPSTGCVVITPDSPGGGGAW